jgi:hypothetical protein
MLSATNTTASEIATLLRCYEARARRKPETASSATPQPHPAAPASTTSSSCRRIGLARRSRRSNESRPQVEVHAAVPVPVRAGARRRYDGHDATASGASAADVGSGTVACQSLPWSRVKTRPASCARL